MTVTINVREARTHLSRLLDRVHAGEEITIAKAGEPYARLIPIETASKPARKPRRLKRQPGGIADSVEFDLLPNNEPDL